MILNINNEDFIQHNKYFIEASLAVDIFHEAKWNTKHILNVENTLIWSWLYNSWYQFHIDIFFYLYDVKCYEEHSSSIFFPLAVKLIPFLDIPVRMHVKKANGWMVLFRVQRCIFRWASTSFSSEPSALPGSVRCLPPCRHLWNSDSNTHKTEETLLLKLSTFSYQ